MFRLPLSGKRGGTGLKPVELPVSRDTPRCQDCKFQVHSGPGADVSDYAGQGRNFWGCSAFVYPTWDDSDPIEDLHPSIQEARGDDSLCGHDGSRFEPIEAGDDDAARLGRAFGQPVVVE